MVTNLNESTSIYANEKANLEFTKREQEIVIEPEPVEETIEELVNPDEEQAEELEKLIPDDVAILKAEPVKRPPEKILPDPNDFDLGEYEDVVKTASKYKNIETPFQKSQRIMAERRLAEKEAALAAKKPKIEFPVDKNKTCKPQTSCPKLDQRF